ncbi:hypothetical protein C8F01DRAFT_1321413 [Mycena amicta]|nr:hypothetical protein C8F01DRAFT_1356048 [Mycena amicta]KAJ7054967.1 hypothetical protein C8F01DRAFT_1321413 [Mycena amicta]
MSTLNHDLISFPADFEPGINVNGGNSPFLLPDLPRVIGGGSPPTNLPAGSGAEIVAANVPETPTAVVFAPGQTSSESAAGIDAAALAAALGPPTAPTTPVQTQTSSAGAPQLPTATNARSIRRQTTVSFRAAQTAANDAAAPTNSNDALTAIGCSPAPLSTETAGNHRTRSDVNISIIAKRIADNEGDSASRHLVLTQRLEEHTLLVNEVRIQTEANKAAVEGMSADIGGLKTGFGSVHTTLSDSVMSLNSVRGKVDTLEAKIDSILATVAGSRAAPLTSVNTRTYSEAFPPLPIVTAAPQYHAPPVNAFQAAAGLTAGPTAYPYPPAQMAPNQIATAAGGPSGESPAKKRNVTGKQTSSAPTGGKVDVLVYPVTEVGPAINVANDLLACFPSIARNGAIASAVRLQERPRTISIRFRQEATALAFIYKMDTEQADDNKKIRAHRAPAASADPMALIRGEGPSGFSG